MARKSRTAELAQAWTEQNRRGIISTCNIRFSRHYRWRWRKARMQEETPTRLHFAARREHYHCLSSSLADGTDRSWRTAYGGRTFSGDTRAATASGNDPQQTTPTLARGGRARAALPAKTRCQRASCLPGAVASQLIYFSARQDLLLTGPNTVPGQGCLGHGCFPCKHYGQEELSSASYHASLPSSQRPCPLNNAAALLPTYTLPAAFALAAACQDTPPACWLPLHPIWFWTWTAGH